MTSDDKQFTFRFSDGKTASLPRAIACGLFELVCYLGEDCREYDAIEIPFALADYEEMMCAIINKSRWPCDLEGKLFQISNFFAMQNRFVLWRYDDESTRERE